MNATPFLLLFRKDDSMRQIRIGLPLKVAACLVGIVFVTGYLPVRSDEPKPAGKKADSADAALEKELLELNRPRAQALQRAWLLAFIKDRERAKKGIALAVKMQKEAKADRSFNFSASIILGRTAHFLKENDAASFFYEHCVKTASKIENGSQMLQAYEALVDLLWDTKKFQKVIDVCTRFDDLNGPRQIEEAKPFMLERLAQAKAKLGNITEALRIAAELSDRTDGSWFFIQLKGWIQHEAGRYDDAIKSYLEVLDKLGTTRGLPAAVRDQMKDRVQYTLSGVYVDKKDIDKAAKLLQGLGERHPDNPTYKNDLGYIWADHDQKLDESEKLIREALDLDRKRQEKRKKDGIIDEVKESNAYLDSMGWVLFKKKKYAEALVYLKKAATDEDEGAHLEIWSHLGDVYMALGQKKEATDAWQKALTMDDVSKRDVDRRKKAIAKLKAAGVEPKVKAPPAKSEKF
jgi:tetratricopeptide (TPR) repeat protein